MNITLRQLRAFVAVVQTGSFTQAAEALHVTQSALSGLVKEMEQLLGVKVLSRSTRRVVLTEVGRSFYPMAVKLLQDLDGALSDIAEAKALKKGVVRVAAPQLMSCTFLPDIIADFSHRYPDVQVQLSDCVVEDVVTRVYSGEVELGIGPERDLPADIEALPLFRMPFVVVCPADHPLSQQPQVRWRELAPFPLITLQGSFTERLRLDLYGTAPELSLQPSSQVLFMTTAMSMVSSGLGLTICLPYARGLTRLYGLQTRPLVEPVIHRRFNLFIKRGHTLSPAAQEFVATLQHYQHDSA